MKKISKFAAISLLLICSILNCGSLLYAEEGDASNTGEAVVTLKNSNMNDSDVGDTYLLYAQPYMEDELDPLAEFTLSYDGNVYDIDKYLTADNGKKNPIKYVYLEYGMYYIRKEHTYKYYRITLTEEYTIDNPFVIDVQDFNPQKNDSQKSNFSSVTITEIKIVSLLFMVLLIGGLLLIVLIMLQAHLVYFGIPLENNSNKLHFKAIYIICHKISDVNKINDITCKYNEIFDTFNNVFTRKIPEDISSYSKEILNDRNALFSQYQSQLRIIYNDLKGWKRRYKKTKDKSQLADLVNELNDMGVIISLAEAFVRDINDIDSEYARFSSDYNTALKSLGDSPSIPLFEDVIIPQSNKLTK